MCGFCLCGRPESAHLAISLRRRLLSLWSVCVHELESLYIVRVTHWISVFELHALERAAKIYMCLKRAAC